MTINESKKTDALDIFSDLLAFSDDEMTLELSKINNLDNKVAAEVKQLISSHIRNKQDHFLPLLLSNSVNFALGNNDLLFLSGEIIDDFKLIELIGEGGQGVVYKAQRCDGKFDQTVAIKLLYPAPHLTAGMTTLNYEAQSLAKFSHHGIVRVFNIGEYQHYYYMVMDYVPGLPLNTFLSKRNLSLDQAFSIFLDICDALEHAHNQQILHADIKPSNILINSKMKPSLVDFGIARESHSSLSVKSNTKPLGFTLNFSSPEQLNGDTLNFSSDVYSAAKVFQYVLKNHFRQTQLKVRLINSVLEQASLKEAINRTPTIAELRKSLQSAYVLDVSKIKDVSNTDRFTCYCAKFKPVFTYFFFISIFSASFLYVVSSKNTTIREQQTKQNQAIDFLSTLFTAQESNGEFYKILNNDTMKGSNTQPLISPINNFEGHGNFFSPYVFTNHGGKVNEEIKLKVIPDGINISDLSLKVKGGGYISSDGYYHNIFYDDGIHTITIQALKYNKRYEKLTLRFIIRNGSDLPIKFSDVTPYNPYYTNIHYLAMRGIVIGRPSHDGKQRVFQPEQVSKQAEALSILFLSAHEKGLIQLSKTDKYFKNLVIHNQQGFIEDFSWANAYLNYAHKAGFLPSPHAFNPKKPVSKEWLAVTVSQLLQLYDPNQLKSYTPIHFKDMTTFNDLKSLKHAQLCHFYKFCSAESNYFHPKKIVTRAEVADIGAKILQLSERKNTLHN